MTVGWILEGDRDRFLSAREATPPPAPVKPSFQCPFCKCNFPDREQLNSHTKLLHLVKRPFILIGGAEPGSEDVIRPDRRSLGLETFNCTELEAGWDGEPVRPIEISTLATLLGTATRATVRIRLVNVGDGSVQPVVQEYHLRVVAPDELSLAKVDQIFLEKLAAEAVDIKTVGLFYETTRSSSASEYAEALGDYVRAVLIKDGDLRTGVSARIQNYREIQNRALNVLRSFDRPLAKLLCALMRFSLNDFSRWREPTGFSQLDYAYDLLGPLAEGSDRRGSWIASQRDRNITRVFACPVDHGTDTVTRLAIQAGELSRWGSTAEEHFSLIAESANPDALDRAKIRALWAVTALRLGAIASAQRALRLLDGDPTFGEWASDKLERSEQ